MITKYFTNIKLKNKRIYIDLIEDEQTKEKAFGVLTKRLIDFKTRNILETQTLYSVETMFLFHLMLEHYFESSELKNKYLLQDLNEIYKKTPFQVKSNFTK